MSSVKVIKKGQLVFKAGDKIQNVIIIQSGQVNLCIQKNNKTHDIMTVGNGYVFADLVVLGFLILHQVNIIELLKLD